MEEWKIFLTIGEILALFFLVGKPILKLNGTLTKLEVQLVRANERMDKQETELDKQKKHASESHRRLWEHETEQDKRLENLEGRLKRLEEAE